VKNLFRAIATIGAPKKTAKETDESTSAAPRSSTASKPEASSTKVADSTGFSDLGLIPAICSAVAEEGYTSPTPIQKASVPDLLKGRDLLGCAQTGTGKTAAFALPILQILSGKQESGRGIRALVLTPTRELAIQVADSFHTYGRNLNLKCGVIVGGVGMEPQKQLLRRGVDILVSTPGRLLDLKSQGFVDFRQTSIFVLDEADRMLDMGFIHDVKKIIAELPKVRQNLLFSATMPDEIASLIKTLLRNPVTVEVAPVSSTSDQIEQSVYFVGRQDKRKLLLELIETEQVSRGLVFTRTKAIANRVTTYLNDSGVTAEAIHGNKSQSARQRALGNFKDGKTKILVASDLAARGLDVELISHVFNYDLPNVPETYVHRIGRTGRAAAKGLAISFCDYEERDFLRQIERLIGKPVPVISGHAFPESAPTGQQLESSQSNNSRRPSRPSQQSGGRPQGRGNSQQNSRSRQPGQASRGANSNCGPAGNSRSDNAKK
jgi:ATP-dependent RNA helicase RhlE